MVPTVTLRSATTAGTAVRSAERWSERWRAALFVGAMVDRQERDLRQIQGVNVSRTSPEELNVSVQNEVLFDFPASAPRPSRRQALQNLASVFDKDLDTTIKVEGFTDSIGFGKTHPRGAPARKE